MNLHDLKNDIQGYTNQERAMHAQRFFKTGKGEYAEGDVFLGLTVPQSRVIAKKYNGLPIEDSLKLLMSRFHEERLIALFILVSQFAKRDGKTKREIYELYLSHTAFVNNWDLVDSSADKIVGEYLFEKVSKEREVSKVSDGARSLEILQKLATSESLWERRIAIIATFAFIKHAEAMPTLQIAEVLLHDKHDLIHKAVGWMLREMGKKVSLEKEETFLNKHYKTMPRTMLRYAIELFSEEKKKLYMKKD